MGLNVNGSGVAGMRWNGAEAAEARLNGAVVWPDAPVDPWPTKPYLELANGSRVRLLECEYDPTPDELFPGGALIAPAGLECSAFYPDVRSAGVDLSYEFTSGCILEYEKGVEFRLLDQAGNVMEPRRSLRDMANTYGVTLFYAYVDGLLCMGIWYSNVSYITIRSRADNGVPGVAVTRQRNRVPGLTTEFRDNYHAMAMALLREGGNQ